MLILPPPRSASSAALQAACGRSARLRGPLRVPLRSAAGRSPRPSADSACGRFAASGGLRAPLSRYAFRLRAHRAPAGSARPLTACRATLARAGPGVRPGPVGVRRPRFLRSPPPATRATPRYSRGDPVALRPTRVGLATRRAGSSPRVRRAGASGASRPRRPSGPSRARRRASARRPSGGSAPPLGVAPPGFGPLARAACPGPCSPAPGRSFGRSPRRKDQRA